MPRGYYFCFNELKPRFKTEIVRTIYIRGGCCQDMLQMKKIVLLTSKVEKRSYMAFFVSNLVLNLYLR